MATCERCQWLESESEAAIAALEEELSRWRGVAIAHAPVEALVAAGLISHSGSMCSSVGDESEASYQPGSSSSNPSQPQTAAAATTSATPKPSRLLSTNTDNSDEDSFKKAQSSKKKARQRSLSGHKPVRGFTAIGLADLAAAEKSNEGLIEAKVMPKPYTDPELGEVTIVRVRTPDRPGLLADLTALLAGLGLSCAKAVITTEERDHDVDMAVNEFWVQEPSNAMSGDAASEWQPVRERSKRSAIEQRLRQWSAAPPAGTGVASAPLQRHEAVMEQQEQQQGQQGQVSAVGSGRLLPPWPGASLLSEAAEGFVAPPTAPGSEAADEALLETSLASALMSPGVTWLSDVPPCLARRLAKAVLPQMLRLTLEGGACIERSAHNSAPAAADAPMGEEAAEDGADAWLLLLEQPMAVTCRVTPDAPPFPLPHPAGAVLALTSSVRRSGGGKDGDTRLSWHSLSVPLVGSTVRTISRAALRALLGDTRKAAVRSHAATLARAPLFAPLSPSELLALCHRGVEEEATADEILLGGPTHDTTHDSPSSPPAPAPVPDQSSEAPRRFMVLLSGSAVVTYTIASASSSPTDTMTSALPKRLPIAQLGPMATVGAVGALVRAPLPAGVQVAACAHGATLLSWVHDDYLVRMLSRLPELLSSSWAAEAPLALAPHVPKLLELVQPMSVCQMRAHLAEHSTSTARNNNHHTSTSIVLVLRGTLYEDLGMRVSIERQPRRKGSGAASGSSPHTPTVMSGGGSGSNAGRTGSSAAASETSFGSADASEYLTVTVELAARSHLLADLSTLLADLSLHVTDANIETLHGGNTARDVFSVRYHGSLALPDLEAQLRQRLRAALQVTPLQPGACVIPDPSRLPTAAAPSGDGGEGGGDDDGAALVGVLDLRKMGSALVQSGGEVGELFARCLQCRAPRLWMSLESGTEVAPRLYGGPPPTTKSHASRATGEQQAERWLSELRRFMLLRLRIRAGGMHVDDGIELRDLQMGVELGTGAYGVVHLARSRLLPERWYAVKLLQKAKLMTRGGKHELKIMEREREVLMSLARECRGSNHHNLYVRLVASGQDRDSLQLVMPAVLGGELFHLLDEHGMMTEAQVQFYSACLVLALQHLHSIGIAYRDLKAENVLLTGGYSYPDAGWPVLADMGLANFAKQDLMHTFCGTPTSLAPEVASNVGYGVAADWFSLGCLVCQCLTLCTPFEGPNQRATINNILRNQRTLLPPLERQVSTTANAFIDALLSPDPAERLGGPLRAHELRVHPFFWGLEWSKLEKRELTPPHAAECRARADAMIEKMAMAPPSRAPVVAERTPVHEATGVPAIVMPQGVQADEGRSKSMSRSAEHEEWPEDLDIADYI